ncbi:MAG: sigma 54-interacting transcriptional regulator [Desulfobacterales bacterium]|nr:sigma 54-interacting transcriptional regulator [Desulfobacterales bacterium]
MENRLDAIPAELLLALLDNPYESLILVDADGIVRFMSSSTDGSYAVPLSEAVGKHIAEVNPETRLPKIMQTGKAEIGRSMLVKDKERIIARIPLVADGRVVGAAGKLMFSSPRKLKRLIHRIESLEKQLDFYRQEVRQIYGIRFSFDNIIGQSAKMEAAKTLARKAAENDSPVIILGESGTGKEMFAHAIHQASRRSPNNFIRINCSAIPAELVESELFGYDPGAFTGASRQGRVGKFELAHGGTIFLDEIGEMPLSMQVKLMRVLQDKEIEHIGGGKPRRIDFRIISATNRELEGMIRKGSFRLDLFYRLNVMVIHLPCLRDIPEDIPLIFESILKKLGRDRRIPIESVSPSVIDVLMNYRWPGNIRELRNVAERAMIVCINNRIEIQDLPAGLVSEVKAGNPRQAKPILLKNAMEAAERRLIEDALNYCQQNKVKAADMLGIHRTGLYQKLKKYGMI